MITRLTLFSFEGTINISGDNSREVTPVPISNTEVKLSSADDTWRDTAWESRTLPVLERENDPMGRSLYVCKAGPEEVLMI